MTDITLPREVVKRVMDALYYTATTKSKHPNQWKEEDAAMKELRAALEQPQVEQETIGEAGSMPGTDGFTMACFRASDVPAGTKLYTHPQPKREPLTDADLGVYVSKELADYTAGAYADYGCAKDQLIHFARAIERAHGIGGDA